VNPLLESICSFVSGIGIPVRFEVIGISTFVPGILIRNGGLIIDADKVLYPGDVLHEAGHLAVMPPRIRAGMNDDIGNDPIHQGGELMAIAWSYAACIHLQVDPCIVFHEHGYKGEGANIVKNFSEGHYFGVPLLQWQGMCAEHATGELPAYPHMKEWLCSRDLYEPVNCEM
jgi:hypothetical protein